MKRIAPIWRLLRHRDRRRFVALAVASSILAFLDMIGVTMVFPLVFLMLQPETDTVPSLVKKFSELPAFGSMSSAAGALVVAILAVFVMRGIGSILIVRSTLDLALKSEARTAEILLRSFLNAPLTYHLRTNTATIQRTINEALRDVFQSSLVTLVPAFGDVMVAVLVSTILLIIAPLESVVGAIALGSILLVYKSTISGRLERSNESVLNRYRESLQYIQQSLNAVKEIQLRGAAEQFSEDLLRVRLDAARHLSRIQLLGYMPRYLIEVGMIVSAALVGTIAFTRHSPDRAVAVLAIFAAAVMRVLPSLNRVMVASIQLTAAQPALRLIYEALEDFEQIEPDGSSASEPIGPDETFERLRLEDVSFSYPETSQPILKNVSLTINRGDYIGITGSSGAGKTTLLNILLGLLTPDSGRIMVNGVDLGNRRSSWQQRIGYVPQDIAFLDSTIATNVALGADQEMIDEKRIEECISISQLDEVVARLPKGIHSSISEAGKALSGGQRQRLGLARALYHRPEVLILDEATSSLDHGTESALLDSVDRVSGDMTVIVVAHRRSTVERCTRVVELTEGVIQES